MKKVENSSSEAEAEKTLKELKKLRLESKLRKNLTSEMERQKELSLRAWIIGRQFLNLILITIISSFFSAQFSGDQLQATRF